MDEQLSRSRLFLGEAGQEALTSSFIVVVGLGGVGSHAAHMLARSGVGRLRLVDFDNVSLSSLNRHAVATRDDVGRSKVAVCAERFHDFVPGCHIDCQDVLFEASMAAELLGGAPDYVVDAIDDVRTKADLLEACAARGIPVITALAAGAKSDPTRIVISDLVDTTNDPLAIKLRYELRSRNSTLLAPKKQHVQHVKAVYSYEKASVELAQLDGDQMANPDDYGAVAGMRIRVVPVLGTQPALLGMTVAASVLTDLAQQPFAGRKVESLSATFAKKLADRLRQRERQEYSNDIRNDDYTPVADTAEAAFVVEQLWGSKSAFSDARIESRLVFALTRFDRSKPALPYNLIFVTREEADAHDTATRETGSVVGHAAPPPPHS